MSGFEEIADPIQPSPKRTRPLLMLLGFVTLLIVSTLSAVSAADAATCTYSGCKGKDPVSAQCSRNYTMSSRALFNGLEPPFEEELAYAELRYSRTCKAAWVRLKNTDGFYDGVIFAANSRARLDSVSIRDHINSIDKRYARRISRGKTGWSVMTRNTYARACIVEKNQLHPPPRGRYDFDYGYCTSIKKLPS